MSRRYADRITVSQARTADGDCPDRFTWRGRRYLVRSVLARWVEAAPWWNGSSYRRVAGGSADGAGRVDAPTADTWSVWRVEAIGGSGSSGVYDLCAVSRGDREPGPGSDGSGHRDRRWFLVRAFD